VPTSDRRWGFRSTCQRTVLARREAANDPAARWCLHRQVGGFEADEASTRSASQAGGL